MTESLPPWLWDESRQVGTDYSSVEEIRSYDKRMSEIRDVKAENGAILARLALSPGSRVLEVGSGTGSFARAAAKAGFQVVAIDVSLPMLDYARGRAIEEGLGGIEFQKAGFLTYEAPADSFDAIVSGLALHHLPDLWKSVAFGRMARLLKSGGRLLLNDVVFDWGAEGCESYFTRLIRRMPSSSREAFARHVRQEYSTLPWILEGLLERAGFKVVSKNVKDEFLHEILARKL